MVSASTSSRSCPYGVSAHSLCSHRCRIGRRDAGPERRKLPVQVVLLLMILAFVMGTGAGFGIAALISSTAPVPQIVPDATADGNLSFIQSVRMGAELVDIVATAPASVVAGANLSATPCYGDFDTYYTAIIDDSLQESFYAGLLDQFRALRQNCNLDDDAYVELLSAYVQAIVYDDNASAPVKYPVVTAVGGTGDCDDTSLLLAGLLAREGYDVALLLYQDIGHMAVGVRTDPAYAYPQTGGYAYIETTGNSLILCGNQSRGVMNGTLVPDVIRIGNGTKTYDAGQQTMTLFTYLEGILGNMSVANQTSPLIVRNPDLEKVESGEAYIINAFDRQMLYRYLIGNE